MEIFPPRCLNSRQDGLAVVTDPRQAGGQVVAEDDRGPVGYISRKRWLSADSSEGRQLLDASTWLTCVHSFWMRNYSPNGKIGCVKIPMFLKWKLPENVLLLIGLSSGHSTTGNMKWGFGTVRYQYFIWCLGCWVLGVSSSVPQLKLVLSFSGDSSMWLIRPAKSNVESLLKDHMNFSSAYFDFFQIISAPCGRDHVLDGE